MFFGIVLLGLLHGLCIMPVYLSLMCWRPAVIRPRSVRDNAEKVNDGLYLESIESEEEVGANSRTALPLSGLCVEETREPKNAEQASQKNADGKNGEIRIQNDAVANDDKKDVGENKQDNAVINEPELNEDKFNRVKNLLREVQNKQSPIQMTRPQSSAC